MRFFSTQSENSSSIEEGETSGMETLSEVENTLVRNLLQDLNSPERRQDSGREAQADTGTAAGSVLQSESFRTIAEMERKFYERVSQTRWVAQSFVYKPMEQSFIEFVGTDCRSSLSRISIACACLILLNMATLLHPPENDSSACIRLMPNPVATLSEWSMRFAYLLSAAVLSILSISGVGGTKLSVVLLVCVLLTFSNVATVVISVVVFGKESDCGSPFEDTTFHLATFLVYPIGYAMFVPYTWGLHFINIVVFGIISALFFRCSLMDNCPLHIRWTGAWNYLSVYSTSCLLSYAICERSRRLYYERICNKFRSLSRLQTETRKIQFRNDKKSREREEQVMACVAAAKSPMGTLSLAIEQLRQGIRSAEELPEAKRCPALTESLERLSSSAQTLGLALQTTQHMVSSVVKCEKPEVKTVLQPFLIGQDLADRCKELVTPLYSMKNVGLHIFLDPELENSVTVIGDCFQLQQVLITLLTDVLEDTATHGIVGVQIFVKEWEKLSLQQIESRNRVKVRFEIQSDYQGPDHKGKAPQPSSEPSQPPADKPVRPDTAAGMFPAWATEIVFRHNGVMGIASGGPFFELLLDIHGVGKGKRASGKAPKISLSGTVLSPAALPGEGDQVAQPQHIDLSNVLMQQLAEMNGHSLTGFASANEAESATREGLNKVGSAHVSHDGSVSVEGYKSAASSIHGSLDGRQKEMLNVIPGGSAHASYDSTQMIVLSHTMPVALERNADHQVLATKLASFGAVQLESNDVGCEGLGEKLDRDALEDPSPVVSLESYVPVPPVQVLSVGASHGEGEYSVVPVSSQSCPEPLEDSVSEDFHIAEQGEGVASLSRLESMISETPDCDVSCGCDNEFDFDIDSQSVHSAAHSHSTVTSAGSASSKRTTSNQRAEVDDNMRFHPVSAPNKFLFQVQDQTITQFENRSIQLRFDSKTLEESLDKFPLSRATPKDPWDSAGSYDAPGALHLAGGKFEGAQDDMC